MKVIFLCMTTMLKTYYIVGEKAGSVVYDSMRTIIHLRTPFLFSD